MGTLTATSEASREKGMESKVGKLLEEFNSKLALGGEAYFALRQETDPGCVASHAKTVAERAREVAGIADRIEKLAARSAA